VEDDTHSRVEMVKEGFERYLRDKKFDPGRIEAAISSVQDLEGYIASKGHSIDDCDIELLKGFLSQLIEKGENSLEKLLAVARYCAVSDRSDLFIYLATILNSYDILSLMERRTGELMGEGRREAVFFGFQLPPLGTPPEEFPPLTHRIIDRMEDELTPEQCRKVLTWNYHEIPEESFLEKKKRFEKAESIDDFLANEHRALIEELQSCSSSGRVWYEQEVTQEFLDHVISNQMLQTGVRQGDRIICEKVPFDPKNYYKEKDQRMRRYYNCHCPLVRSAIKKGKPKVSPTFCYCSAGYTKLPWDVIFEQSVEAEVLESVLAGDDRCVFSIKIPEGKMK
jgi:hypothetical protein